MVSSVASIEFRRRRSACCLAPNRSALARARNDQVTASFMPRAPSARRASGTRRCSGLRTGLDVADRRGRDVVGMLSKPKTRVTSSTRSASPTMSGRHGGTAAVHGPLPSTVKPSLARIEAVLSDGTSIAVSVFTRSGRSVKLRCQSGMTPLDTTSLASPPHSSRIRRVATSAPHQQDSGSMPRSLR